MQVMFVGNQQDERDGSGGVTFYGVRFPLNKAVDVSHLSPAQKAKLTHNNHFQVVVAAPAVAAPVPAASAPTAVPSAPVAVEEPAAVAAPAAAPPSPPPAVAEASKPPRIVKARGATAQA